MLSLIEIVIEILDLDFYMKGFRLISINIYFYIILIFLLGFCQQAYSNNTSADI